MLVSIAAALVIFQLIEHARPQPSIRLVAPEQRLPPSEPHLQVDPPGELQTMRAEERARLNGYGWVDESRGIVHIPIDRAMKLLVERGLPVRQAPPAQAHAEAR